MGDGDKKNNIIFNKTNNLEELKGSENTEPKTKENLISEILLKDDLDLKITLENLPL